MSKESFLKNVFKKIGTKAKDVATGFMEKTENAMKDVRRMQRQAKNRFMDLFDEDEISLDESGLYDYNSKTCDSNSGKPFPHQQIISDTLDSLKTPKNILVASRTGSGKSRSLWDIVRYAYNEDQKRPIIIISPGEAQVRTLKKEFIQKARKVRQSEPNELMDMEAMMEMELPVHKSTARKILTELTNKNQYFEYDLAMKQRGHRMNLWGIGDNPKKPVRFMTIDELRDALVTKTFNGPRTRILKWGVNLAERSSLSALRNLYIIVDEAHYLLKRQNRVVFNALRDSENTNVAFFTATPLWTESPYDCRSEEMTLKDYEDNLEASANRMESLLGSEALYFVYHHLRPPLYPMINPDVMDITSCISRKEVGYKDICLVQPVIVNNSKLKCDKSVLSCNVEPPYNPWKVQPVTPLRFDKAGRKYAAFKTLVSRAKKEAPQSKKFDMMFDAMVEEKGFTLICVNDGCNRGDNNKEGMRAMERHFMHRYLKIHRGADGKRSMGKLARSLEKLGNEVDNSDEYKELLKNLFESPIDLSSQRTILRSLQSSRWSLMTLKKMMYILDMLQSYEDRNNIDEESKNYISLGDVRVSLNPLDWTIRFVYRDSENQKDVIRSFNRGERISATNLVTASKVNKRIKCLVVNSRNFMEGVSFRPPGGVSQLILTNPPSNLTDLKQVIGRPLRACAYRPGGTLRIKVFVTTRGGDKISTEGTLDEQRFCALQDTIRSFNKIYQERFVNKSFDNNKYTFSM